MYKSRTKIATVFDIFDKNLNLVLMIQKKQVFTVFILVFLSSLCFSQPNYNYKKIKKEKLGRGLVVIKNSDKSNFLTWRYLSSDSHSLGFNIYRNGTKINQSPVYNSTCFVDENKDNIETIYELKEVLNGKEKRNPASSYTLKANAPVGYINIPLSVPAKGFTPVGDEYFYSPNDATIGDVDGDGEYEIILKWSPSNGKDNAHDGYSGNTIIDCYKLDGSMMWRIDLGKNIRSGAHYTQFMVYDLDGDNKAELVVKTADGTIDGKGNIIGDINVDYRNKAGRILEGPEYLTVFNGETGEAIHTIDYEPSRGDVKNWGDNRGNRSDRFLACIAYLDGINPSVVMCRGYYTRTVLVAYDFVDGRLKRKWTFDSNEPGNEDYAGQGNHNLRVGDVDCDGCDEIVYGSCTIDNDGTGLYTTGLGHGDAMHLSVFDPALGKLQVWDCHENKKDGSTLRDAATGEILFQIPSNMDVGRCMAADIDPNHKGLEMWSTGSKGVYNIKGECINPSTRGVSVNMACWWDGDLLRELQNGNEITKYNPDTGKQEVLLKAVGAISNNGTKANPSLVADIVGDWREELLLRTEDNKNLRLYVSTHMTPYKFYSFLEDPIYRISVATQNVAYNQPTQPGFYFGSDLGKCFNHKEYVIEGDEIVLDAGMDYDSYEWSVGGNTRERKITLKDIPSDKRTKIELKMIYRGQMFSDYVYVTLNSKKNK